MRSTAVGAPLFAALLVAAACVPAASAPPQSSPVAATQPPVESPAVAQPEPSPAPSPSPAPKKARFFVAAEFKEEVWVLEGEPLQVVAKVPVGRLPHNISVSPNGRWVATANRMSGTVSVIDPRELREVARIKVGRQPHDLVWATDAASLFVGSEREGFIHRIEAETWKALAPLRVGVPQHTLAIHPSRPSELWFTLTNVDATNHLRVYHLDTDRITEVKTYDNHDVFFTPDGSEVWTSTSGFLDRPSDRVVIHDPETKTVKQELRFPGRYPFHSMKHNRDARFFVDGTDVMVLSDHTEPSLMFVDWRARKILGSVKLEKWVFHTAYTPGRYYTTNNMPGALWVIDAVERTVLYKLDIPRAHGVVFTLVD